jgi:WD40 repeat protein
MASLAFIILAVLIVRSQGPTQSAIILSIITSVGGFVIGVFSLVFSFLQWHHPHSVDHRSEPALASLSQTPAFESSEHPPSPGSLTAPPVPSVEGSTDRFPTPISGSRRIDWGEAPQTEQFYGRKRELAELKRWLLDDHCRLVSILGMGGIGKTSLAAALVEQVYERYDAVFWRSLQNAPPLQSILQECLQFVSGQQMLLPSEEDRQITLLIDCCRSRRFLLVLDNVESLLQGGGQSGQYREGCGGYGRLFQRMGESRHQSCLLITSREKQKEVALLEGEKAAVRSSQLAGLPPADGQEILKDKGLDGTEHIWETIVIHYGGNPLALRLVGQLIREVFGGDIAAFLTDGEALFRDIRDVLEQQIGRLSVLEEEIVYWLAIQREAVGLSDLQASITHPVSQGALQEALRSLQRRQLIETSVMSFTLHHVIMEYLTDRFIERVCEEIRTGTMVLFERHALLLAQAKDYIRESQRRLLLLPLVQRLLTIFGKEALEQRLQSLLATLREQHDQRPSYAAGNILNLLIQMGCELRGYDFSHLVVWQAYLQGVVLPEVNFAHANLAKSTFTDTFGSILCVTFSPRGDLLVAGTATGEIRFWHGASGSPLHSFQGHANGVTSVAFSPDGSTLASTSHDLTFRLWEVNSGKLLKTLQGHTGEVWSVALSPDEKTVASGSLDRTVRLWEMNSGECLNTLQGHTDEIWSVAFSPDGKMLASGSRDRTVHLWDVRSGKLLKTLQGHTGAVESVTFSPDGQTLASSGHDRTIRVWEVSSGECLKTLEGHTDGIWSVAFSPDGKTLASGSFDRTVRFWEAGSGKLLNTLQDHTSPLWSVAFSPDGKTLASGGLDRTVRLWEVSGGKLLKTLQGYANRVRSVAFSPDGKTLASGHEDQMVRVWEVSSGRCLKTLQGHTNQVASVAFSPEGSALVSGGLDRTVRLWKVKSGECLKTLQGHTDQAVSVAFSPDGKTVASGSRDRTVRIWEVSSGVCLKTLEGHSSAVWSVAFNPDGQMLASSSDDRTVRLWEVSSGKLLKTLQGHTKSVEAVTFSPDGSNLASSSNDRTVRLWEVSSGTCLKVLQGHTSRVWSVAFSPDGSTLVSGSIDQTLCLWEVSSGKLLKTLYSDTSGIGSAAFSPDGKTLASGSYNGEIKLWDRQTGACLGTLRSDRPYERMNITRVKGLTEGQKATLKLLGAIEEEEQELE